MPEAEAAEPAAKRARLDAGSSYGKRVSHSIPLTCSPNPAQMPGSCILFVVILVGANPQEGVLHARLTSLKLLQARQGLETHESTVANHKCSTFTYCANCWIEFQACTQSHEASINLIF